MTSKLSYCIGPTRLESAGRCSTVIAKFMNSCLISLIVGSRQGIKVSQLDQARRVAAEEARTQHHANLCHVFHSRPTNTIGSRMTTCMCFDYACMRPSNGLMQDLDVVCRKGHRLDASRDGLVVALGVSGRTASSERCSAAVMAADEHHRRGHTADCMCAANVTGVLERRVELAKPTPS